LTEYAPKGNLSDYIAENPDIPLEQKLRWCKQAAEAANYIHEKNVLHCDVNSRSFLLDINFDLLLADFQGVLLSTDGEALLDGQYWESS
jgi:serine/threonine protein kinase